MGLRSVLSATVPNTNPVTYTGAQSVVIQAVATDVCGIFGSASKLVRVHSIRLYINSVAARQQNFQLRKWTTAPSTGSAVTVCPHDSNFPAATAAVYLYTANPSGGSGNTSLGAGSIFSGSATITGDPPIIWMWPLIAYQPVLRGVTQAITVSFLGVGSVGTDSVGFEFVWSEE